MNKLQYLENKKNVLFDYWWNKAGKLIPQITEIRLVKPEIVLNHRLVTTAGFNYDEKPLIELNTVLFYTNIHGFGNDTIPHELAHYIADNCFDSSGHDKGFYMVGEKLTGRKLSRCHSFATFPRNVHREILQSIKGV